MRRTPLKPLQALVESAALYSALLLVRHGRRSAKAFADKTNPDAYVDVLLALAKA